MDDTSGLLGQLGQQDQLQRQAALLRQQQQSYGQAIPNPQFTVGTPGFSARIGDSQVNMPGQTQVNYGDIIGKGVANFLSARAGKQASDKENQAAQINNQFMMSTLQNDPAAAKLYAAAKAGLPGAAKALEQHIAPKKEALAGFVQGASSGMLSPDMLAELAPKYGLDPEVARSAGAYAVKQKQAAADQKLKQQQSLEGMKLQNQITLKGIPQAKIFNPNGGNGRGQNQPTPGTYEINGEQVPAYQLSGGEKQQRVKTLEKTSDTIAKGEAQVSKFPDVWKAFQTPGQFGVLQRGAETLSNMDIPVVSSIGIAMRSKGAALLADYINSETLSRMAQLGGNDSNEELRRMQSSLPTALNNKEAMKALLIRMDSWQKRTLGALKAKRQDMQSGKFYDPRADGSADYYSRTPGPTIKEDYSPQESGSAQPSPDMFPKPKGGRKSFDDIFNEVNK